MPPANMGEHPSVAARTAGTDDPTVFVVSTPYGAEQAFSCRADAERYAEGRPGTSVSEHRLRRSVGEAVVIVDRRVVVMNGELHADLTTSILQFKDDPFFISGPADVESFSGEGDQWHIVGFGTDEEALNTKMATAIESACRMSRARWADSSQ